MSSEKFLCVMADDFGMHSSVNNGIVRAFTEGLVTDSNLMAPCPDFDEAAELTKAHQIPVGVHATFTSDYDVTRWKPLTEAASLTTPDGYFRNRVADAWAGADESEALQELQAQHARIVAAGIYPTHVGEHMGVDPDGKALRVMRSLWLQFDLPHKEGFTSQKHLMPQFRFDSYRCFSHFSTDFDATKAQLKNWLFGLKPGYHLWVVHPGSESPEANKMCSPDFPNRNWANLYRVLDLKLTIDPEVKAWLGDLQIQTIPICECPVALPDVENL